MLTACGSPARIGDSGLTATYGMGTLSTTLPARYETLTVLAAVERVAGARGFVVAHHKGSAEQTTLTLKYNGGNLVEEYSVTVRAAAKGTQIDIWVTPWGNRDQSELFLRDVLDVLGIER